LDKKPILLIVILVNTALHMAAFVICLSWRCTHWH